MLQFLRLFTSLLLLYATYAVGNTPPTLVYNTVNVITGEYCEAATDLTLHSAFPLKISRTYTNTMTPESWQFNLPNLFQSAAEAPEGFEYVNQRLHFEYDEFKRLQAIYSDTEESKEKTQLLKVNYFTDGMAGCEIKTADGRNVSYRFQGSRHPLLPPFLLVETKGSEKPHCQYRYADHPLKSGKVLVSRELPEGRYLLNEYEESGKVKLQKAPLGQDGAPIVMQRFVYGDGFTEVYNALGRKNIYRFSQTLDRLTATEEYQGEQLYRKEQFTWELKADLPQLVSRATFDGEGICWLCRSFDYDAAGRIIKETLHGNLSGDSPYPILLQDSGRPIQESGESYSTCYSYSTEGLLISQEESNGTRIDYQYAEKTNLLIAKLISNQDHIQIRHFYSYDHTGRQIEAVVDDGCTKAREDLQGASYRYTTVMHYSNNSSCVLPDQVEEYQWEKSLDQQTLLQKKSNIYSLCGLLTHQEIQDAAGHTKLFSWTYDEASRPIAIQDEKGSTLISYDSNGNRLSEERAENGKTFTTSNQYDFSNRLISSKQLSADGESRSRTHCYDYAGYCLSTIDQCGNVTSFRYDGFGRVVETQFPSVLDGDDQSTQPKEYREYDLFDRVRAVIDANGYRTETHYNVRGQPIQIIHPDGSLEQFRYHLDGTLKNTTKRSGTCIEYFTDFFGRITAKNYYDSARQLVSQELASEPSSPLASIAPTAVQENHVPDEKGYPITYNPQYLNDRGQTVMQRLVTEPSGNRVITTYDALGRSESIVKKNSLGEIVAAQEMRYDPVGNKVKETHQVFSAGEQIRTWSRLWKYGAENQVAAVIESPGTPQQVSTAYFYDEAGRLSQLIKPDGIVLHYAYDALDRMSEFFSSDYSVHYRYVFDDRHHLVKVEDLISSSCGEAIYEENRLICEKLANGLSWRQDWDSDGHRARIHLPDDSFIEFKTHDEYQLSILRKSRSGAILYKYDLITDDQGKLLQTQLIGDLGSIDYTYDTAQRLIAVKSPYWSEEIPEYGIDNEGQLKRVQRSDPKGINSSEYVYDARHQLIQESGDCSHNYKYDSLFNRCSKDDLAYTVNQSNQLLQSGEKQYAYDANGCLIEMQDAESIVQYSYDALNRLTRVTKGINAWLYTYDSYDRRLSTKTLEWNATTQSWHSLEKFCYLYDGNREIAKIAEDGSIAELRVFGRGEHLAAIEIQDKIYAPIQDHYGSICCLIDMHEKEIAEFYRYSAFGEVQVFDGRGALISQSSLGNPWLYANRRHDDESGLVYFGKRFYSPETGRWLTPDPWGGMDGPNHYAYVLNNPLVLQDPYGLFSLSSIWEQFLAGLNGIWDSFVQFGNSFKQWPQIRLSPFEQFRPQLDPIFESLFGKMNLILTGYYSDQVHYGIYGNGEVNDKLRVTCLNGILSIREDQDLAKALSESHGGVNIHYVLYPSDGWTWDFINGLLATMGFVTQQARTLAETWKMLIAEMGGVDGGGKILHYAHSIGGTNTAVARDLLTPEEQKMIEVITIGSAKLIPEGGFASVTNYISCRDIVGTFDSAAYFNTFSEISNVIFVGNHQGIPLIDHLISMETYRRLIEYLGKQFMEKHGQ